MNIAQELWNMRIFNIRIETQCYGKDETRSEDQYLLFISAEQKVTDPTGFESTMKHWFKADTIENTMAQLKARTAIVNQITK